MELSTADGVLGVFSKEYSARIDAFKRELQKLRTGRASAGLVDGIIVDCYGSKTPLKHLGQISVPEPRLILVQVYDVSAIESIQKAVQNAGLGLGINRDGNILRISVAQLTEETRKDIVKRLHRLAEDVRVSIRGHRRDANEQLKKLEKDGVITKDDLKRGSDKIQKQTDSSMAEVDKLLAAKEAECMEV